MKNLIVIISACFIVLFACNSENKKNEPIQQKSKSGGEKYFYYDDELDVKSTVTVDTAGFRKEMTKILPSRRIVELFGGGYQVFYLLATIDLDGKVKARISPEGAYWFSGLGNVERGLFKENIEIANNFAITPQPHGDSKAIDITEQFYMKNLSFDRPFKSEAGMLNGKKVRSGKAFQLDAFIGNDGKMIKQWNIHEIDIAKFRTHLKNNLARENYMGFFPAVLKDDYKSLKDKVVFPAEAIKHGVSGKILIKLFFETDGKYSGYQLIKGLGYGCEEAVIKAIENYPLSSYPSGERTTLIAPFRFGESSETKVDLTSSEVIEKNPDKHNNLYVRIYNKLSPYNTIQTKYFYSIIINSEIANQGLARVGDHQYFFKWKPRPGTYDYVVSIDPENVLNDVDRSNNIVRGKLVIK